MEAFDNHSLDCSSPSSPLPSSSSSSSPTHLRHTRSHFRYIPRRSSDLWGLLDVPRNRFLALNHSTPVDPSPNPYYPPALQPKDFRSLHRRIVQKIEG